MKKTILIILFFIIQFNGLLSAQEYKTPPTPTPVDPWKYTEAKVTLLEEAPSGSTEDRIGEIVEAVITEKYTGSDPFYQKMSYPALKLRVKEKKDKDWYKCEVIGIYPANLGDPMYRQSTEIRDCPNMNYADVSSNYLGYFGPLHLGNYTKLLHRVDRKAYRIIYYYVDEIAEDCEIDDFYKKNLTGIHLWTTTKISAKPFQQINRYVGDGGIGDDGEPFFRISSNNYLREIPDSAFMNIQALREFYPVTTYPASIVLPVFHEHSFHPAAYLNTAVICSEVWNTPDYVEYYQLFYFTDKKWLRFLNHCTYSDVDESWTTVNDVSVDKGIPNIKIEGNLLIINDLSPDSRVEVYDLTSRLIKSEISDSSGTCQISFQNNGFYIIKAGRFTKKILINSNI